MNEIEITIGRTLPIWWAMAWRGLIASVIAGAILGGVAGFVMGFVGHPESSAVAGGLVGYIATIPISMWALKASLNKKYKAYQIKFVKSV